MPRERSLSPGSSLAIAPEANVAQPQQQQQQQQQQQPAPQQAPPQHQDDGADGGYGQSAHGSGGHAGADGASARHDRCVTGLDYSDETVFFRQHRV